nr:MAG TPA: Cro/C1-type HTH DNA-binding domain protein [Caudoviricetes sp.]
MKGTLMKYCYDRLWKKLIDAKMTKTEMRQLAGISANVLAKMGKGEPVSLDSLTKICSVMNCSFDDIIEIIEQD